jgi:hypothetical protein
MKQSTKITSIAFFSLILLMGFVNAQDNKRSVFFSFLLTDAQDKVIDWSVYSIDEQIDTGADTGDYYVSFVDSGDSRIFYKSYSPIISDGYVIMDSTPPISSPKKVLIYRNGKIIFEQDISNCSDSDSCMNIIDPKYVNEFGEIDIRADVVNDVSSVPAEDAYNTGNTDNTDNTDNTVKNLLFFGLIPLIVLAIIILIVVREKMHSPPKQPPLNNPNYQYQNQQWQNYYQNSGNYQNKK